MSPDDDNAADERTTDFLLRLLRKLILIKFVALYPTVLLIKSAIAQGGPVYINPNAPIKSAPVAPAAVVLPEKVVVQTAQAEYVTQTVYGFLDFTTTIGECGRNGCTDG